MTRRTKQRIISASDLDSLDAAPDESKPLAMWLWLNLDPMGRGPMDPMWISSQMNARPSPDTIIEHLLMLMEAGFLATYQAEGREWIVLLHPLKVDLRDTRITTPEPPHGIPLAVGRGGARASGLVGGSASAEAWARGRAAAEAQVRAEDAARADAWDAVQRDREPVQERPERPIVLDAPQMFCDEHMPGGPRSKKCGPCRDFRLLREEWMARRIYTEKLAMFTVSEQHDEGVWDDEPF